MNYSKLELFIMIASIITIIMILIITYIFLVPKM
jgi:hypothetical protein